MPLRVTSVFAGPQIVGGGFNVMHFDSASDSSAAADAAEAFWATVGAAMCTGNTVQVNREVELISESTGVITGIEDTGAHAVTTGANSNPISPASQGLIRLRTGVYRTSDTTPPRTKEIRGRIFIPAISESSCTAGVPDSAIITVWEGALTTLLAATPTLVVWSREHLEEPAVISGSVWNQFAVLRRRRD